ncbi:hypothetical protein D3C86_1666070 [compost metagenome]
MGLMMVQPALKQRPDFSQWRCPIDIGLADVGQFPAKGRQLRPPLRAHEALKVVHFAPGAVDQAGADFNDFHFRDGPATFIGSSFQVDHQPMRHSRLPFVARVWLERSQNRHFSESPWRMPALRP